MSPAKKTTAGYASVCHPSLSPLPVIVVLCFLSSSPQSSVFRHPTRLHPTGHWITVSPVEMPGAFIRYRRAMATRLNSSRYVLAEIPKPSLGSCRHSPDAGPFRLDGETAGSFSHRLLLSFLLTDFRIQGRAWWFKRR